MLISGEYAFNWNRIDKREEEKTQFQRYIKYIRSYFDI